MLAADKLICFTAYDVRGKIPEEFNEEIAYRIGRAVAQLLASKKVVVSYDARETSYFLSRAASNGIRDFGADVLDIGLSGTEEMYAAVSHFGANAGIQVTASHNPIIYNGMKIVREGSRPLSIKELSNVKELAEQQSFTNLHKTGSLIDIKTKARNRYTEKILSFVDWKKLKPLKIVINSGNGVGGPTIDAINKRLVENCVDVDFVYVCHNPDPSFPNGIPNPLIKENRKLTRDAIIREHADLGVAFDSDFDRCFIFDQNGSLISGEYVVGILAEMFLKNNEGARIVHDHRCIWNITDSVRRSGGVSVMASSGHTFMKNAMREVDAIYGGEMSSHHYFRDFFYCDSGMIPWLLIWELLSKVDCSLTDLIQKRKSAFLSSDELNFRVSDPTNCLQKVKSLFDGQSVTSDELDGLSMGFKNWRFNLRVSNTEPLIRLNIEVKGNAELLEEKIKILKDFIEKL